jgi:hypothetical protein
MKVRMILAVVLLGSAFGCNDSLIGIGNNDNNLGAGRADEVAEALAALDSTPPVTDEDVQGIFRTVLRKAGEGDPEAALIILRLAARQRATTKER